MDAAELLRIVDSIHREKKIPKEIIIAGIESGLLTAAKKYYGDDCNVQVHIDPVSGQISASHNGIPMPAEEISQRIGAQTAKQVMIQKIREAERDMLYDEYKLQIDELVIGKVHKIERGTAIVQLGNIEAILPFSEMIPMVSKEPSKAGDRPREKESDKIEEHQKESIRVGDQICATIAEVKKQGSRVKVILSRIRTHLVKRLFEENIPEIAEGVIVIKGISREPGYRSKVAVVSDDQRIDCVGSCVGVRGNRIKDIKSDLAGEQIDIVPWDPDPMKFIPNALKPAEVEETILCTELGRAIVLVKEEQLSLGIGKKGQNVRLASKLCGWDIEIMTSEELQETLDKAVFGFRTIPGVSDDLADMLVGEGFVSYDDLSIIEPDALQEMGGLTPEEADSIISEAERRALELERLGKAQQKVKDAEKIIEDAPKKIENAQQKLEQVQKKLEQVKKKLEQAKKDGLVDKKEEASRELEKTLSLQIKATKALEKAKEEPIKAKAELEKATPELEKIQHKLHEKELIRRLPRLEDQFMNMQELQKSINDKTRSLDEKLQKNNGEDSNEALANELDQLLEDENEVLSEGNQAQLLSPEDSPLLLQEDQTALAGVVEDIQGVIEMFNNGSFGADVQTLQEKISATLEQLLEAVKRQQSDFEEKEQ